MLPAEDLQAHASTEKALSKLRTIGLVVLALASFTYVLPGLSRVRPWVVGEGIPIVRLFTSEDHKHSPGFEGGQAADRLQAEAHAARAAQAAKTESGVGIAPGAERGAESTPRSRTGVVIDPSEYEGLPQPIEHVEALAPFYEKLKRSALGEADAITRVAHYGDSAIAADEITLTLRRSLQKRFGDAGHGFMLIARGAMHYLHRDIVHRESDGWEVLPVVRRSLRNGLYGYGGVLARARGGEYSTFGTVDKGSIGTRAARFELFYQRFPGGGDVRISVDDEPAQTLSTRAPQIEDAWHSIDVPDGKHLFSLRTVGSEVRLYGMVLERKGPGIVYDSLGLVGARADRLLDADAAHMARQIAHRDPDLLVLAFGGNESANAWLDIDRYATDLAKVIKHMRAGKPSMPCLLFAPLDQGERNERGNVVTVKVLPSIVEAQRRVAGEQGCAFYDAFAAMGGKDSVGRWYKQRPRLFTSDFRHATPEGYAAIGGMYYKALLKGFADHLARH